MHAEDFVTSLLQDVASDACRSNTTVRSIKLKSIPQYSSSDDSSSDDQQIASKRSKNAIRSKSPATERTSVPDFQEFARSETAIPQQNIGCGKVSVPVSHQSTRLQDSNLDLSSRQNIIETASFGSSASTVTIQGSDRSFSSEGFEKYLVESIEKIVCHVDQHSLLLNELVRNARRVNEASTGQPPKDLPSFPISSLEEFKHFDSSLSDDSLAQYMENRLAAVGGSGLESLTRRLMRYLMVDSVASSFNWKGRDKLAFKDTKVCLIIKDAAKINFQNEQNDHVVENTIKEWLKHAKTRLNNRKK